ncbi:hypothetical protein PCANC_25329 [Puccinia coronata f. sp. avenae]|uniref:Uncharacterized protein n=1 Tax=Puccinia coronata f. sp. avenae TaxID=200324 RepID=A0A2N5SH54_9BASI|nr:hypothetical protein PCANC_25329 [Puccinia coronata f. sp. avenae]
MPSHPRSGKDLSLEEQQRTLRALKERRTRRGDVPIVYELSDAAAAAADTTSPPLIPPLPPHAVQAQLHEQPTKADLQWAWDAKHLMPPPLPALHSRVNWSSMLNTLLPQP